MVKIRHSRFYLFLLIILAGFHFNSAKAQSITAGLGVGGLGGDGSDSSIGWTANLNVNSIGWAAFHAEVTVAPFKSGTLLMGSPAFAFYPMDLDGFLFGGLVGVGFYKLPVDGTLFGFNYGVVGDFAISKKVSVGMTARQHLLTGGGPDAIWNVLMSVGYKFDGGGDW